MGPHGAPWGPSVISPSGHPAANRAPRRGIGQEYEGNPGGPPWGTLGPPWGPLRPLGPLGTTWGPQVLGSGWAFLAGADFFTKIWTFSMVFWSFLVIKKIELRGSGPI